MSQIRIFRVPQVTNETRGHWNGLCHENWMLFLGGFKVWSGVSKFVQQLLTRGNTENKCCFVPSFMSFFLFFQKIQWSFFFLTIWSFLLFNSVLSWATLGKALQGHIKKQVCTECYFLGVSKFVQQLLTRGNTENKITLMKWQTDIVVYFWSKHRWWILLRLCSLIKFLLDK